MQTTKPQLGRWADKAGRQVALIANIFAEASNTIRQAVHAINQSILMWCLCCMPIDVPAKIQIWNRTKLQNRIVLLDV